MNPKILSEITTKLQINHNFVLKDYAEIDAGMSNKLFVLTEADGTKLLLKHYFEAAKEPLQQREYKAIKLMRKNGITNIPKIIDKNRKLHYVIYSFEQGNNKKPNELTKQDIEQMVDFLVAVHTIPTESVDPIFKRDEDI